MRCVLLLLDVAAASFIHYNPTLRLPYPKPTPSLPSSLPRFQPPALVTMNSSPLRNILDDTREAIVKEWRLEREAVLVELPVMFSDDAPGSSFDFDRWEEHRSSGRYGRLLIGVLSGVTTRRISVTVALLVVFSGLVDWYAKLANANPSMPEFELPLTPFELTAPVLGLLLVFRTNTAYERFNAGSDAAWDVTGRFRSVMRQLIAWSGSPSMPPEERVAVLELIESCCLMHGWIMTCYLRGEPLRSDNRADLLRCILGAPEGAGAGDSAASQPQAEGFGDLTPWLVITALSYQIERRLPSMEVNQRIAIDGQLTALTSSLGTCERLLRTPIPLGYTRYSVRFLWIWLTLLPFALVNTFATFGMGTWWETKPQPVLVLAVLFIGFIFLSIEDIAVQIEEPFKILPLEQHQKWLDREAGQLKIFLSQLTGGSKSQPAHHASGGEEM